MRQERTGEEEEQGGKEREEKKKVYLNCYQKAKFFALRVPTRLLDTQIQDVNHGDLAVLLIEARPWCAQGATPTL